MKNDVNPEIKAGLEKLKSQIAGGEALSLDDLDKVVGGISGGIGGGIGFSDGVPEDMALDLLVRTCQGLGTDLAFDLALQLGFSQLVVDDARSGYDGISSGEDTIREMVRREYQ